VIFLLFPLTVAVLNNLLLCVLAFSQTI